MKQLYFDLLMIISILVFFVFALIERNYGIAVFDFILFIFSVESCMLRARVRSLEKKNERANALIMRMTTEEVEEISKREITNN